MMLAVNGDCTPALSFARLPLPSATKRPSRLNGVPNDPVAPERNAPACGMMQLVAVPVALVPFSVVVVVMAPAALVVQVVAGVGSALVVVPLAVPTPGVVPVLVTRPLPA